VPAVVGEGGEGLSSRWMDRMPIGGAIAKA